MFARVAERCERVLELQRLEGPAEVDGWEGRMVLMTRCCSVVASVFVVHKPPLKISVAASRWGIDDSESVAPALRYTAAAR